jgi:hypothetical protein
MNSNEDQYQLKIRICLMDFRERLCFLIAFLALFGAHPLSMIANYEFASLIGVEGMGLGGKLEGRLGMEEVGIEEVVMVEVGASYLISE